jgi:hypothetical protein
LSLPPLTSYGAVPRGLVKRANGKVIPHQTGLAGYCDEQLNALEFERTEDRVRYICPDGQHDDLAMSLAMLAWAADHPDFMQLWVRPIEDQYRQRPAAAAVGPIRLGSLCLMIDCAVLSSRRLRR